MADIKDLASIANKWAEVTPGRASYYRDGVSAAADWAGPTAAAEGAYEQGVQAAVGRKAYSKGVRARGTQGWKEKTLTKGPDRFSSGVSAAGPAYTEGFAPYHAAIQAVKLPPKRARGDPANYQRVAAIGDALHKRRIAQS